MSNEGNVLIQPSSNVVVDHAAVVAKAADLKNDYPIVIVERADVQKVADDLPGGTVVFQ